jgi:cytochrome P450
MTVSSLGSVRDAWPRYLAGDLPPSEFWSRVRDVGTVFVGPPTNAWLIARYQDVRWVLSDEDVFKHVTYGPGVTLFRNTLLDLEGEAHRTRLGLVGGPLKSRGSLEGHVRPMATEHTARIMKGLRGRETIDVALELNEPLPLLVITEMVNIPAAAKFRSWYQAIASAGSGNVTGDPELRQRGQTALDELYEALDPVIRKRREDPQHDLLSTLVEAEIDGVRLSDDEVKSFTALILVGGVETSARALTNLQRQLLRDGELWRRVREDRSLLLPGCAEALRFNPPVLGLTRMAARDVEVAGTQIKAGDRLYSSIYSANRDEQQFTDPESFVLERFKDDANRQFSPVAGHMAFGGGRHFCTGAQLAKVEMEVVMDAVLDDIDSATVVADAAGPLGEKLGSPNSLKIAPRWA